MYALIKLPSTLRLIQEGCYGADVISRIQYALNGDVDVLTNIIRSSMVSVAEDLCYQTNISPAEIGVVSVVRNPAMQQLFLGISPKIWLRFPTWQENGELKCSVIGGGEAKGICGSGIIDAVAAAIESGLLNKRGRIQLKEEINGQILFQSFRCF